MLHTSCVRDVAPLVGAWIEIDAISLYELIECVAPLVGAWIEMSTKIAGIALSAVAPLVGAWIEIVQYNNYLKQNQSLPSWERGLKYRS